MLREQPSHDELAIFRGVPILSIATVELLGHPLRKCTFVRPGSEAKGRSLQSGIAGRHASEDNRW